MRKADELSERSFVLSSVAPDGTPQVYYYRARYYLPAAKRFVSEDPIGIAGGINVFGYVGGNPVSMVDPSGLNADPPGTYISFEGSLTRRDGQPWGAGCGDANTDDWVPDLFKQACAKHDVCYANQCGKEKCDDQFYADMRAERPGMPRIIPWIYFAAVKAIGGHAYAEAGKKR